MLVTEALNELKTLDSRIRREIGNAKFIVASKKSEKNALPGVTKQDFTKDALAAKQSIDDLIKRREKIKAAIIASNAITEIEINGEKMTVAKAIDTKESIIYLQVLLAAMKTQYLNSVAAVNSANTKMDQKIDELLITLYGKDGKDKITAADYAATADPYKERNEVELVDPLQIKQKIDDLEQYIEGFTSNVDAKLQISNCVTSIDI